MVKNLIEFGLTAKEAEVYLTLLQSGDATADQLAKSSKLNRSTTYVQIKQLTEYGLVSTFKRGKKTFFAAESPNNLARILEQRKQQITRQEAEVAQLVPELLKLFGSSVDRPVVRVFEGKEGLVSMRNNILESGTKNMLAAFSFDSMAKIFSTDEMMAFSNKRAAKKIQSRLMYKKTGDDIVVVPPQEVRRVDEKTYPFGADVYIYNDTVSFASTQDQIVGVSITNADIAKTMRMLYETVWESLT
jgi:HTH-type transcriptional regulator, sugar sensing transcriptional regulator